MSGEPENEDVKRVRAAVTSLGEHFETVQVFVTRHEPGTLDGTKHIALGSGNWFARFGQIQQWNSANDQEAREHVKRQGRQE